MQNGAKDTANASAPSISADFLTGSTEIGLDRIRTRLLDLTNRNKLLNFRHSTASSLRVVDVPLDTVFRHAGQRKACFLPVPEPDIATANAPPAKDYADELGWNTSFDLGNSDERAQAFRSCTITSSSTRSAARSRAPPRRRSRNPARTCSTSCSDSWSGTSPMTRSSRTWPPGRPAGDY